MSPDVDSAFCRQCGDRLPPFGSALGYCSGCADRYRHLLKPRAMRSSSRGTKDPLLSSLLSALLPGAGQVYTGHWLLAILLFVTAPFVLPWLFGIVHAWFAAQSWNERHERNGDSPSLAAA